MDVRHILTLAGRRLPIRARILLLAVAAMIGVAALLIIQYQAISRDITALNRRIEVIDAARRASTLIHALQKERGMSAGYMIDPMERARARLFEQRLVTDATLARAAPDRPNGWTERTRTRLDEVRRRVDAGWDQWDTVSAVYSETIVDLIDEVSHRVLSGDSGPRGRAFLGLVELSAAREALGLIRASLNRAFTRGEVVGGELIEIAARYGAAREQARAFTRDIRDLDGGESIADAVFSPDYVAMMGTVEWVLAGGPKVKLPGSAQDWWGLSTTVIDALKLAEDAGYDTLARLARADIEARRTDLTAYSVGALSIAVVVMVLAVATVSRILVALSALLGTLGKVVRDQDFGLRIRSDSKLDEFDHIGFSVNRLLDYTDSLLREKELLASTDILTGLPNRRAFVTAAEAEIERAARYGQSISLIIADLDHFRRINRKGGHSTGDQLLQEAARVFADEVRASDLACRWGGEEFVVLAPETNLDKAAEVAEKLRAALAAKPVLERLGPVTASFGVAGWRGRGETLQALFDRADRALIRAKADGRDRVAIARDEGD